MQHLVKTCPDSVRLATGQRLKYCPLASEKLDLHFGLELPHFLMASSQEVTLIFPADLVLELGDVLETEYGHQKIVTKILERRKARGDWSANPFDTAPDFIKVLVL